MMMKKIAILCLLLAMVGQVTAQVRLPERPNRPKYVDHELLESGFWFAIEGNIGSGVVPDHTNAQRAGGNVAFGYMVNEFLKLGVGAGANCYFNNNEKVRNVTNKWTIPVYFDMRGVLVTQEVRTLVPYWSFDIGYAAYDGFFFSPTIGIRLGERRNSWLFGFNYTFQQLDNLRYTDPATHIEKDVFPKNGSFLGVKIGYEF